VAAAAIAKRVLKDYCGVEVLGYVKKVGPLQLQHSSSTHIQVERL
jgi:chorismate synthase